MPKILATCNNCHSKVPIHPEFADGTNAKITNHTVTDPCPNCGGLLEVKDGIYSANSYKVLYRPISKNSDQRKSEVTRNMMYGDYVQKLAREFNSELEKIEANHNFEYGDEFEKAIVLILRRVLPDHFGVCRGYVVDQKGNAEGDDIIIYDRMRFPRLRPVDELDMVTKQRIPIEAVYAYIEAKHTLTLSGASGQSFAKALEQVHNVKALCNTRLPLSWRAINRYVTLSEDTTIKMEQDGPKIRNPLYAGIFARFVRHRDGSPHIAPSEISSVLQENKSRIAVPIQNSPDLVILGNDVAMLPMFQKKAERLEYVSPFQIEGAKLVPVKCTETAFGVALCSLLFALDNIELGRINWSDVIGDAITRPNPRG